jgi:hypothetical protein
MNNIAAHIAEDSNTDVLVSQLWELFRSGNRSEALYRAEKELDHERFLDFLDCIAEL